jgi:FkbM family methyltransferase
MKEANPLVSGIAQLLPHLTPYAKGPVLRRAYWALYEIWEREGPPIRTSLYGFRVLLNRGNLLPFFIQNTRLFNAPLVELVYQMARTRGEPLTLVDVGAAVGDTVLLVKRRCPGAVSRFICIEGDTEFHELLAENMRSFTDVTAVKCILAREPMLVRSLVKHHKGTAACTGSESVQAVSLDSVSEIRQANIDLIKIDVDGFDGEVLAGAVETLRRCHPAVIFEWDPRRISEASTDPFGAFDALAGCGYNSFAWFNNNGTFSHFSDLCSHELLKKHFDYLLAVNHRACEHFDVVALPAELTIDEIALVALDYARSCSRGTPHRVTAGGRD